MDTIKLSEFDAVTNGTDVYWCDLIDRLVVFYRLA